MFKLVKPVCRYMVACVLGSATLVSCEATGDEVTPQETFAMEHVDAAKKANGRVLPHKELARLRAAVARYHNFEHAVADGYDVQLTEYRRQMGFHYVKLSLLDGAFDVANPEVLLYVPAPNGGWRFVGVEYAVPIADLNNPQPAPEGFTGDADAWVINREFSVWTLHVWVGLNNPDGIFAPMNPRLP